MVTEALGFNPSFKTDTAELRAGPTVALGTTGAGIDKASTRGIRSERGADADETRCIAPRAPKPILRLLALASLLFLTPAALAEKYELPLFVSSTTSGQQGMVRILNHSDESGSVSIVAINNAGTRSSAATLTLDALAGVNLDASDIESGNATKGVTGGIGSLQGNVRLEFDTELAIQILAYLRTSHGTLSELHGEVSVATSGEDGGHSYLVPTFNAAQEMSQKSQLRLVNPTDTAATVSIEGRDDSGAAATGGSVGLTLPAGGATTLTAQQLEAGGTGLTGQFGAGSGRWRLRISSDQLIEVISLVESSTGHLANLSMPGRGVMEAPPDTSPSFAEASPPSDQTYTVDMAITTLTLPEATGGDGTLTYTLTPQVPGLTFDAAARQLMGTPTTAGTHSMTYTATDEDGDTDTLTFTITVQASDGGMSGAEGDCQVGQQVSPGESCTYPGTDSAFSVDADGRGSFLVVSSMRAINLNKVTYQGTFYDFRASHQGDGVWRIDRIDSSTTPTTGGGEMETDGTAPVLPAADAPGDRTFQVGTAITTLTLPAATGADVALSYTLTPQVPGLTFDPATRQLSGTPTTRGTHTMTYTVTDNEGNTDSLSFTITVAESDGDSDLSPVFSATGAPVDQTYSVGAEIDTLTLPEATGGDGTLTYNLSPEVPGLTFNATTRQLSGTPSSAGTFHLNYTVMDEGGDTDTLGFIVTVEQPDDSTVLVESFDLGLHRPTAITYGNGRFYVVDGLDKYVYAFTSIGERDAASNFRLHLDNWNPEEIVYANDRIFVVDWNDDKVYAYFTSGQRDTASEFDLAPGNSSPQGITFASGRFYVVDRGGGKVYAYTDSGERDAASDFELDPGNPTPSGISYADGRFFVVDWHYQLVFVYSPSGEHDLTATFALHSDNANPEGIAYVNGRFYLVDQHRSKVYSNSSPAVSDNDSQVTAFESGDWIPDLPTGYSELNVNSGTKSRPSISLTVVNLNRGGYIEAAGLRFTCQFAGGCEIRNEVVVSGRIVQSPLDRPGLPGVSRRPGDQRYTVDVAIETLTLPQANGGDGILTYALSPNVPGLEFNATKLELTGTPSTTGEYVMSYTVTDADGDSDSYSFTIHVELPATGDPQGGSEADGFALHSRNPNPTGITFANNRLYVTDQSYSSIYAYSLTGQYDAGDTFRPDSDNAGTQGITFADGRFYLVDQVDDKVYAYSASGRREALAEFALHANNTVPTGITHANDRFYVVDGDDDRVYVYTESGQYDGTSNFDLHTDNANPQGITHVGGRFYVVDFDDDKVYVYATSGQRRSEDDFDLHRENIEPSGITFADDHFYVVDFDSERVFEYDGPADPPTDHSQSFNLETKANTRVRGLTYANNRFFVLDWNTTSDNSFAPSPKVYGYSSSGQRSSSADFDLNLSFLQPEGITFGNGQFYMVDRRNTQVYAYSASGQRQQEDDFGLDFDNSVPTGIAYANGRFFVVDWADDYVYAYSLSGNRDRTFDFRLNADNLDPEGVTFANGRFYVIDRFDKKVYAYSSSGQRQPAAEFDLHAANANARGISYANGRFYVVDSLRNRVYAYADPGDGQ